MTDPSPQRNVKEPIRKPWIWIVLGVIILAGVPWYWPPGTITPVVFGVPLWALIIMLLSVVLSAFLSWVCRTQWSLTEEGEDADG